MGTFWLRVIMASLVVFLFAFPVQAQQLWGIYEENEIVKLLFETKHDLTIKDAKSLKSFKQDLGGRLKLKYFFTLEPIFPQAPSLEEAERQYGFKPRFDLRKFYVLEALAKEDKLRSYKTPFHLSKSLQKESKEWGMLAMKTIEPDFPVRSYLEVSPQSSSDCPKKEHSPPDRAWSLRNMKVQEAWKFSKKEERRSKGLGEKIGHPDTGYTVHDDLDEKALEKKDENNFLEENKPPEDPLKSDWGGIKQPGHGTATGSVIISRGGVTDDPPEKKEGGTEEPGKVTGVAPQAKLVPYRAIESVARLTYTNVIKAIDKAVKDECSVISLSLGGIGTSALEASLERAIGNNVIVVAAAGNSSHLSVVYPAKYSFCIAVAATNSNDQPWESSAHGKNIVTVSAPGESVWRALSFREDENSEEIITKVEPGCGTSYSTANVAGVAALWLAHHKNDDLIEKFKPTKLQFVFKKLLEDTARKPEGWKIKYGSGIVDAAALLEKNLDDVKEDAKKYYEAFITADRTNYDENWEIYQENQNMHPRK